MKTIVILGQTATGKSELAYQLAKDINGEIVSADSIQIYRFFDIGSAKPPKEYLEDVKHHLINIKMPYEDFSAQDFAKEAKKIINNIQLRTKTPILVGGTLFYIDALVNSLDLIPQVDETIKNFFNDIGEENLNKLYDWLKVIDPKWALKINKNDKQRINRALSVYLKTGKNLTSFFKNKKREDFFNSCIVFYLHINDDELKIRIKERTEKMIDSLIEETSKLTNMGFAQTKPMQSIGYRQALEFINCKISKTELIDSIIKETLSYAKRQKTYFLNKFKNNSISISFRNAEKAILNYL